MKKGYTLVELLTVVVMCGILITIFIPTIAKWRQVATVEIEGKQVFRGHAFCVEVRSAGAATQVDIGLPCTFPGKHWTDKDVKVIVQ